MKSKQVLYVNGEPVTPAKTTLRNTFLICCLIVWCVFITNAYFNLKSDVRNNSNSIDNLSLIAGKNADYLKVLSKRESGGNWRIVGGYNNNYIGLYQFGNSALRDIDSPVRVKDFKKNRDVFPPEAQHKACIALMRNNKRYLRNHYKYIGRTISGVKVNEAGLLAAAHLVGHRAVKRWLESNGKKDTKDGFGTSLVEYMQLMENVKVSL